MVFLIIVDIFLIFLHKLEIYGQDRSQKLSVQTNQILSVKE